jgi:hypothetical protein
MFVVKQGKKELKVERVAKESGVIDNHTGYWSLAVSIMRVAYF